ncbi:MAG: hypothetical protein M5R42_04770 [Rhodocyclaceae bacterium]|nr:hypothetical protein [Rhodocyclaceae bacterium]
MTFALELRGEAMSEFGKPGSKTAMPSRPAPAATAPAPAPAEKKIRPRTETAVPRMSALDHSAGCVGKAAVEWLLSSPPRLAGHSRRQNG